MTSGAIPYTPYYPRDLIDKEYQAFDISTMPRMPNLTERVEIINNTEVEDIIKIIPDKTNLGWIGSAIERLNYLTNLPDNWCSPNALPINRKIAIGLLELISMIITSEMPEPFIGPMENGSLQISWHTNGVDLEIEFQTPEIISVYYEKDGDFEEWETTVLNDLDRLKSKIDQLS
ncbi:hypothetical protein KAU08_03715 [bacterium]|nr:hypothetical protein [bacterium]